MITEPVRARLAELPDEDLPAYLYDLTALAEQVGRVRDCLPDEVELYYAAKANPAEPVLRVLAGFVTGIEVASAGELAHVRAACPDVPLAFGGPAKSPAEIGAALAAGAHRFHVESEHELRLLCALAERADARPEVLLRLNFPIGVGDSVALAMGGRPSPFGLDPGAVADCLRIVAGQRRVRVAGVHAHLASGLDATGQLATARRIADAARNTGIPLRELNIGGGMQVDYGRPADRFDWAGFGAGLKELAADVPDTRLRIEPGRSLTAYCGWYAATVADVKHSQGKAFALIRGGTHHFRTPAAKSHSHPFEIIHNGQWSYGWSRPTARDEPVTIAGQLCTPKDVLARDIPVELLRAGDRVVFGLAGAYAWNISHHEFLMHPRPGFHYLG
ncbi:MAG TPA: type III PLP-dependent enzyme [Pseudonocardiaceae bacterium]|nr:type III PLP-dependent enzyme [Pseudonocardiaceae bacterium]